jgi:hypothetical protein
MKKPVPIDSGNYDGTIVNSAYASLKNKLQPLDFFCTQGAGFIGFGIRQITKNMSPDRECEFNHAGLLPDGSTCTLEALWHVESKNLFEHYEGCKILIGRYKNLTPEKYLTAIKSIHQHIDQSYPKRRLFFHLLNLAHHIHWINSVVCSELLAKALFNAGARDHNWWGVTPDNIADEIEHELNEDRTGPKYEIVFKGKLPWLLYRYCERCKQIYLMPIGDLKCCNCKNNITVEHVAIPNKELRQKVREYNERKLNYITNKIKK